MDYPEGERAITNHAGPVRVGTGHRMGNQNLLSRAGGRDNIITS
jgi:hypothetical protein